MAGVREWMGEDRMRAEWGRRAGAAGAAALTVVAGLGCRAVADGAVAKYAGDALYTVLICALAAVLAPCARPFAVAGAGLLFSWAVELLQLTGVPAELSERSTAARLVLGSTFNAPDLFWYAVGAGAAWALAHLAAPAAGAAPTAGDPVPAPRTSAWGRDWRRRRTSTGSCPIRRCRMPHSSSHWSTRYHASRPKGTPSNDSGQ